MKVPADKNFIGLIEKYSLPKKYEFFEGMKQLAGFLQNYRRLYSRKTHY